MNQDFLSKLWTVTMLACLIASAPSWLAKEAQPANYDAPWIYPGLNPVVRNQQVLEDKTDHFQFSRLSWVQ